MTHTTLSESALLNVAELAVATLNTAERHDGQPWAVVLRGHALRTLSAVGLTHNDAVRLVTRNNNR